MKKILITCLLALSLMGSTTYATSTGSPSDATSGISYPYIPPEGSVEELYKDIIVTLLQPSISDALTSQYGQILPYDLFDTQFLTIQRPTYRGFTFIVKLQVMPFVGAHNPVGVDELTFQISPFADSPKLLKFTHVKSISPPPHLQQYYKDLKL